MANSTMLQLSRFAMGIQGPVARVLLPELTSSAPYLSCPQGTTDSEQGTVLDTPPAIASPHCHGVPLAEPGSTASRSRHAAVILVALIGMLSRA